jgi:hypothetical protein
MALAARSTMLLRSLIRIGYLPRSVDSDAMLDSLLPYGNNEKRSPRCACRVLRGW